VSCIPSTDAAFRIAVTVALDRIDGAEPDEIAMILGGLLRDTYPAAGVHRQSVFGAGLR
jgi:hypothetical protein